MFDYLAGRSRRDPLALWGAVDGKKGQRQHETTGGASVTQSLASQFSHEFELLIACSWLPPSTEQAATTEKIRRLSAESLDWTVFLGLVRRHHVQTLVQKALQQAGVSIAQAGFAAELKQLAEAASQRALQSASELLRLCSHLGAEGIAVVPMKGAILSFQLFGDPGTRHAGDLDLMIRPEDLGRTNALLRALGYVCTVCTNGLPLLRSHSHECSYVHAESGACVDIHWGNELWTERQTAELWNHCQISKWSTVEIRHLEGDALLLFLCDHGSKHQWSTIKWLSDVAMLFAAPRTNPWRDLLALAIQWDLEQPLAEAALLVHQLFDVELPSSLTSGNMAAVEHAAQSMGAMLLTRAQLTSAAQQSSAWQNLRFSARRRKALSWYAHSRRLLIHVDDLQLFPLPAMLAWLYYPLRPLFWYWRRYGRSAQSPQ